MPAFNTIHIWLHLIRWLFPIIPSFYFSIPLNPLHDPSSSYYWQIYKLLNIFIHENKTVQRTYMNASTDIHTAEP